MFKSTLASLALNILAQIPWDKVIAIIWTLFERKVQPAILREIDRMVDQIDKMDMPGEEKFARVFAALRAPNSPVRVAATDTATYLLDTAIQVAVAKLRSIQSQAA